MRSTGSNQHAHAADGRTAADEWPRQIARSFESVKRLDVESSRPERENMSDPFAPRVGGILSADIAVPEHDREVRFCSRVLTTGENPLWREDL